MANMHDDILSNIFIRLPAKQIAQMRSLSKLWNTFLSQSSFIKSHLDSSIHNNDEILVVFNNGFSFDNKPHPSRSPHIELTNTIKLLVVNKPDYDNHCRVIGSVNGFICFAYSYERSPVIHIWNPSLSALLRLPPYTKPSPDGYDVYFRFGYDLKTDGYKVVKLTRHVPLCGHGHLVKGWLKVEVYSMRKGVWKLITKRFPSHITHIFDRNEVCIDAYDGHLHWLVVGGSFNKENELQRIVAFDLGLETFSEISLPVSIQYYKYDEKRSNVLGIVSGKLCLMSHVIDGVCDVWVMDEYGVIESWVKRHVFSQDCGIQTSIGFTLKKEFLFKDNDGCLSLFDPIEGKVTSSTVMVNPKRGDQTKIVRYVDSLVWVEPAKHGLVGRRIVKNGYKRNISLKGKGRKKLRKKD